MNIATSDRRFVIGMVVVFFLTPFIVSKIGVDRLGLWLLGAAVAALYCGAFHVTAPHPEEQRFSKDRLRRHPHARGRGATP